jgi:hypothetical protein
MIRTIGYRHMIAWLTLLLSAGTVLAFEWSPEIIRPGDQRYLVEVRKGEGDAGAVFHVEIVLTDLGGSFDAAVTLQIVRTGVAPAEVGNLPFYLGFDASFALMAASPNMIFAAQVGVAGDVTVRDEPVELMFGMGRVHYEREELVAGLTCVVVRVELTGDSEHTLAVAEGVPFPCFSDYGEGDGRVRTRILEAD